MPAEALLSGHLHQLHQTHLLSLQRQHVRSRHKRLGHWMGNDQHRWWPQLLFFHLHHSVVNVLTMMFFQEGLTNKASSLRAQYFWSYAFVLPYKTGYCQIKGRHEVSSFFLDQFYFLKCKKKKKIQWNSSWLSWSVEQNLTSTIPRFLRELSGGLIYECSLKTSRPARCCR